MAGIEITGLTKRYGEHTAIDSVNLVVEKGEVFGFLGPNGAGKSTTINQLLGFAHPSEGSASVLGHDATEELMAVREQIGILPEGYDLYPRLTGLEHLQFAIDSKDGTDDPAALLDRVGLDYEDGQRRVGEYSKGMKQRLALAMALAGDPDLLLLDEPSSGLDPTGVRRLQEIVREEQAAGTTVFFSSHVLGHVEAVCDRVGIMRDGQLVAVDTIAGLRETANATDRLKLTLDPVPDVDFTSIPGVVTAEIEEPVVDIACVAPKAKGTAVIRAAGAGSTLLDIRTEEPSLADLFEAYTTSETIPSSDSSGSNSPSDNSGTSPAQQTIEEGAE
ncbi:ABC transporter ATP-binding protein [Natrialba swarupiae]|uniref:ABC transporter ATP-binding protein n=1 Tax=Natrialba swarupiae TaxID=2448032 RepID=A0A5D5AJ83_9EURY|nr:ABC transporter ATP-binding protein [Natrialba swarupiae]